MIYPEEVLGVGLLVVQAADGVFVDDFVGKLVDRLEGTAVAEAGG